MLLYSISFFQIMFGTKNLDIFCYKGGSSLRIWNYMIKMKIIFSSTYHTSASIAFPYS